MGQYYSSEPSECYRKWYKQFTTPHEYDPEKQGVFEAGDFVEKFIDTVLTWGVDSKKIEVSIPQRNITVAVDWEKEIFINGKSDFLIFVKAKHGTDSQLIEVKSASYVDKITEAKQDHRMQVTPYQLVLKPTKTTIVYVEKNNFGNIRTFDIDYSPALMDLIANRVKTFDGFVKRGEVPFAEAKFCHNCWKAKVVIDLIDSADKKRKFKVARCPNCGWKGEVDETDLWRCRYCPFAKWCDQLDEERQKAGTDVLKEGNPYLQLEVPKSE